MMMAATSLIVRGQGDNQTRPQVLIHQLHFIFATFSGSHHPTAAVRTGAEFVHLGHVPHTHRSTDWSRRTHVTYTHLSRRDGNAMPPLDTRTQSHSHRFKDYFT